MPLDTVVDYPCKPKRELGGGDLRVGTQTMIELLRVKAKADAVRAMAAADSRSADNVEVKIVIRNAEGVAEEQTLTVHDLDIKTSMLESHAPACTNCPVNGHRRPFGCVHSITYPIKKSAERWLLDRVQPPNTIGGALLLQAIEENKYDGEQTRAFRTTGKFQAFPGLESELPTNAFGKAELTADEIFVPFLQSSGKFTPWQCLQILLWFGVVKVDGKVPTGAEDALALTRMEPNDRARRAKLNLGTSGVDAGIEDLRSILKTIFVGWVRDVDILVDS